MVLIIRANLPGKLNLPEKNLSKTPAVEIDRAFCSALCVCISWRATSLASVPLSPLRNSHTASSPLTQFFLSRFLDFPARSNWNHNNKPSLRT